MFTLYINPNYFLRVIHMELETFFYNKEKEWSIDKFPSLDSSQTLVIIFAAPEYINNQTPIRELINAYPTATIIGCSTGGEIIGPAINDSTIVVAIAKFKEVTFSFACTEIHSAEHSFKAGEKIATQLNQKNSLRGIFVLSDGIKVNGSELIKGFNTILPESVVVTGGLAGDGDRFKQTWVIAGDKIQPNFIAAVGFYGDKVTIGHGSKGGWDTFGPERLITKSKNNILYELDKKPALALYKEYLGELTQGLPATGLLFPLSIRQNSDDKREIVRTILSVDEKSQSLIFAGDMPKNYLAKLMRANFDRLVTGANQAALIAGNNQHDASAVLAIAISCIGRRLLLGEYTEEETEITLESLPKETKQIGFYSYGEISPYSTGHCDLHNQTMTITTISEVL